MCLVGVDPKQSMHSALQVQTQCLRRSCASRCASTPVSRTKAFSAMDAPRQADELRSGTMSHQDAVLDVTKVILPNACFLKQRRYPR